MEATNELLRKQLRLNRLILLCLVIFLAAALITCAVIVRNVLKLEQTVQQVEELSRELAQVDWSGMSEDFGSMTHQVEQSLLTTEQTVEALDVEGLNQALTDLKTVMEPLAEIMGRFR